MKYEIDGKEVYNNNKLIRRRFYLSKESLDYVNTLCLEQSLPPSVLLDRILLQLAEKRRG